MQTLKKMMKKLGRWCAVCLVVTMSVVAGLFLMACRKKEKYPLPPPARKTAPLPRDATKTSAKTAEPAKTPPAKKTVDVKETERGQPIPRNMLE